MPKHTKERLFLQIMEKITHYHLNLLTKTQTSAYIDSQMNYANATGKIFEQEIKDMIYEFSGGIPRKINNIATACLINAYIQKSQKINLDIDHQAITEFQLF